MKDLLFTTLLFLCFCNIQAQMDDKFYYPKKAKTIRIDTLQFKEHNYYIEKDTINSVVLLPEQKQPKATILYFHGAGGNCMSYVPFVKPLVKNGYEVIMLDMRGYGKSSGKPTHLNIAADAQFILNSLLQDKKYQNKKLIIYGASMGTQVATNLAKNNPEKIAGLILDGVISSFTDIALSKAPQEQHSMISMYLKSPYSPKEDIKTLQSIPVLFIHSKSDKDVPFAHCETVYNNTKTKKKLWIYEGDHLKAPQLFPITFIQKVNALLQ